jgi:hypothetical protein
MLGIVLDNDLDLKVTNGSLAFGEVTYQNQKILILADKGELKANPMRGVGVRRYLENETPDALAREIRLEFSADGMKVNTININADLEIQVDAIYKNDSN